MTEHPRALTGKVMTIEDATVVGDPMDAKYICNSGGVHGEVFYKLVRKLSGLPHHEIRATVEDARWCDDGVGLVLEQTFDSDAPDADNWNDAIEWMVNRVDAIAVGWAAYEVRTNRR